MGRTGRKCVIPNCGGNLYDTIINFNENLVEETLEKAQENTDQCDVMLALGSSLTVTPAADLPEEVGDRWSEEKDKGQNPKNHLVIVNLQKTPLDDVCSLRIFAKIDDVMVPLMKELGLEIPEWKLQRFMKVKVDPIEDEEDKKLLTISAVDVDGINATVFNDVQLRYNGKSVADHKTTINGNDRKKKLNALQSHNEFSYQISKKMVIPVEDQKEKENESEDLPAILKFMGNFIKNGNASSNGLVAELSFMGNYSEPNLCIPLDPMLRSNETESQKRGCNEFVCRLLMDIKNKEWSVEPYSLTNKQPRGDLKRKEMKTDDTQNEENGHLQQQMEALTVELLYQVNKTSKK